MGQTGQYKKIFWLQNWLWSIMKAATSLMQDSPERIPVLKELLPKRPVLPRGLFGAQGSSSIGLNIATLFF